MASGNSQYPGFLNPFGETEDFEGQADEENAKPSIVVSVNEYPDHLDPFVDENTNGPSPDDYDDSLNPFGDEAEPEQSSESGRAPREFREDAPRPSSNTQSGDNDPFAEDKGASQNHDNGSNSPKSNEFKSVSQDTVAPAIESPSPEMMEPPVPLPRTKSLIKKEQAQRRRLQEQQSMNNSDGRSSHELQAHSLQSNASSTTSNPPTTTDTNPSLTTVGSFQRRKRLAPPVPVNFKRQVSGSLDAIEEELNGIGDTLAIIDKESSLCQETLTSNGQVDEGDIRLTKSKFAELIKKRNSIVRRQKELMYKKRELKLDQLHSDIEYELRMIGNKQVSTRTEEDEIKEKELLKKLVEIVEEKNDIVENLNKDTSCDSHDVEEAFKRLNITEHLTENHKVKGNKNIHTTTSSTTITTGPSTTVTKTTTTTTKFLPKKENCDKGGLAKLSKIATLLPKSSTMKLKRKHLFKAKDCDSRPPIER